MRTTHVRVFYDDNEKLLHGKLGSASGQGIRAHQRNDDLGPHHISCPIEEVAHSQHDGGGIMSLIIEARKKGEENWDHSIAYCTARVLLPRRGEEWKIYLREGDERIDGRLQC